MALTIDHVPYACADLDEATAALESLGLAPEYGGVHDNGVTHMALLGFGDGSYLELISERDDAAGEDHGFWPDHIRADAGPAAWCVRVPDVVAECKRVLDAGHPVRGPLYGSRERDDGTLVEWDRAEFGTEENRLRLPFAISDRTPLSYRVTPSPSVADGPLTGTEQVLLGVRDLDAAVRTFERLYRWPRPIRASVPEVGRVASFPGTPVALVTPDGGEPDSEDADGGNADTDDDEWLADRLATFREGPCACLFATEDLDAARREYPLREPTDWPDGRVAFFDSDDVGRRLGVVERR